MMDLVASRFPQLPICFMRRTSLQTLWENSFASNFEIFSSYIRTHVKVLSEWRVLAPSVPAK